MQTFNGLSTDGHAGKMACRITVPLLMNILHLPPVYVFLLQFIFGILMYFVIISLLYRITDDFVVTVLLSLGLSCTYFGSAFMNDFRPYLDSFSYGILILMFIASNNFFIVLLTIAGAFNDERFILALPIVILWHFCQKQEIKPSTSWLTILHLSLKNKKILSILAGLFFYFFIRLFISQYYHMTTPTTSIGLDALAFTARNGFVMIGFISVWSHFGLFF